MLALFTRNLQPIQIVGGRHVVKTPDGIQRQVDGVELNVRNRMHQDDTAFLRGRRAAGHSGVMHQGWASGVAGQNGTRW